MKKRLYSNKPIFKSINVLLPNEDEEDNISFYRKSNKIPKEIDVNINIEHISEVTKPKKTKIYLYYTDAYGSSTYTDVDKEIFVIKMSNGNQYTLLEKEYDKIISLLNNE